MTSKFQGQTAIVTGGARGIGLGIAQRLASEGANVAIWDVGFDQFDDATANFTPILKQVVDVSNLEAVEAAVAALEAKTGRIDVLVNNAGINGPIFDVADYPIDAWHKVISVDLTGVFFCCRAVLPIMTEAGYGRIVNISSIAGKEGNPRISAYAAAKAGVIGFTKSLAREVADKGVLANCVAPVITETDLFKEMTPEHIAASKSKIPMNRFLTIPEIAATVAFAASSECTFTTGFTFDLSGGRATY
ncbi:SDR family NAD(P)-dependent oxidoreductase (plasmid) [Agrobacterium sp. rho-13.3]|uniref:SDR family NAD(P)-dependent oxidoreductase n=1 Tax=Agrobacterium sp. rho-13.3 TaxID=3072980 RepID=UPI002A14E9C4|nr:SDR family NAD(P)-dependent oxidoreductase [Agrobacterium sp. rho-13.3]MDX8312045.1 SDR family NAD(P)-dependent oxidoreductase [Agrobacterium sp. rho-13.3]